MKLVYFSNVTENTKKFVEKLDSSFSSIRIPIKDASPFQIGEEFILITPTYGDHEGRGMVPHQVKRFLNNSDNASFLRGVVSAGNRNFGKDFALAGIIISHRFKVPLLHIFELAGETEDVAAVNEKVAGMITRKEDNVIRN